MDKFEKPVRQRKYLAKDFDALRAYLLEYARSYYSSNIKDFSESSVGGVFLDFSSYVGDTMSFYLDHQFAETDIATSVEAENIEKHIKASGMKITGAVPATVVVTVYIEIPSTNINNKIVPNSNLVPVVKSNSVFSSNDGIDFILLEDVDFTEVDSAGEYVATVKIGKSSNGIPTTFIMSKTGICVSGSEVTETITIPKEFTPYRKITLGNADVSEIVSVTDGYGNKYYQVSALTDDVVYKNVSNSSNDNDSVSDIMTIVPAPYRFISDVDITTRRTVLTFGGGNANTLEDDIIPDPSDFAISFPYSRTFTRISINPYQMFQTKTLGVAATDTTLQITYRYGGGLNHNVTAGTVDTVKILKLFFPNDPQAAQAAVVKNSIEVSNERDAIGGDDAPTIDDLKELVPGFKNSQDRVVSKSDLLARIYLLPSNFGRVFRAEARPNPRNSLSTQIFIISRNKDSNLVISPDTLKKNIRTWLSSYRMISNGFDIYDAQIINLKFYFDILVESNLNKSVVMQNVLSMLQTYFDIKKMGIGVPIFLTKLRERISNINGVVSVNNLKFINVTGVNNNKTYSDVFFNVDANIVNDILYPTHNGIFEVKYPDYDIVGKVM